MIAAPVPLQAQNPRRTSWNITDVLIRVSMMNSTTFHRISINNIHMVSVLPLGGRTKMVHTSSVGSVLCYQMYCNSTTSLSHWDRLGGGGGELFPLPGRSPTAKPVCVWPGGGCVLRLCFASTGGIPPPHLSQTETHHLVVMGQLGLGVAVPGGVDNYIDRACRSHQRP